MILTHICGPTVLIELDGWRLLTDPTFDPAGGHYAFGWGTSSRMLTGPALSVADLPPIDAVLLTHDHHRDNLGRPTGQGDMNEPGDEINVGTWIFGLSKADHRAGPRAERAQPRAAHLFQPAPSHGRAKSSK